MGITFPSLGNISGCFFSGFIAYAMWRYELFNLNPAVAAENIVYAMPDSLILANLDGKIIRVNDHVVELTEYSCQELDGKQFTDLFLDKTQGQTVLTALAAKTELRDLEAKFQTKNGAVRLCLLSGSVVKNKNARSIGLTFIVHDITHLKQMEQKLVESERFASIGKLAGMVGHDLRNPLASMNGAAYYLKTRCAPKLDKNGLDMLLTIEKSIDYSNKIVNDLLDYSREVQLDVETATAKTLLDTSFSMISIPENIQVIQHTADEPSMKVDATKITRVFVNLIKNAFDAMPQGGTLTIATAQTDKGLEFTFKDTGEGMTDETLSKLWNPLFTTKAKGMGFGLVICKRIVEAHCGEIKVCSALGKGTTFTLVLPLNPAQVPERLGSTVAV
jgi:PAS domain S-box-containing protein